MRQDINPITDCIDGVCTVLQTELQMFVVCTYFVLPAITMAACLFWALRDGRGRWLLAGIAAVIVVGIVAIAALNWRSSDRQQRIETARVLAAHAGECREYRQHILNAADDGERSRALWVYDARNCRSYLRESIGQTD